MCVVSFRGAGGTEESAVLVGDIPECPAGLFESSRHFVARFPLGKGRREIPRSYGSLGMTELCVNSSNLFGIRCDTRCKDIGTQYPLSMFWLP